MSSVTQAIRARWVVPLTGGCANELIEDGLVIIRGSRIHFVGEYSLDICAKANVPVLHLSNHLIIPGLINCHTHGGMSLLRGFADDMALHEWLYEAIWPAEARFLAPDFVKIGTKLSIYEMLKTGTTTFVDSYYHCDVAAAVAQAAGIRIACGEPIIDFNDGLVNKKVQAAFEMVQTLRSQYESDRVIPIINPHACYTVSKEILETVGVGAKKLGHRVNIHLHESVVECDNYSKAHSGESAIQTLLSSGLLNANLIAAHCVCLSEREKELLATHRVNVVHCPKSNLKLASGICSVQSLLDLGVNVALGTDGACSNNSLSMISEMQVAALVGKSVRGKGISEGDATAMSCRAVLRMATYNGAIALGMESQLGSIEQGKLADLVAVDLSSPECLPVFDPVSALVYSTGATVSHVWVGGQLVVEEGTVRSLEVDISEVQRVREALIKFKEQQCAESALRKQSS